MNYIVGTLLLVFATFSGLPCASDEIVVGRGESSIVIQPDTASECGVTSIERYDRYFLFQRTYFPASYYLISQHFEVGEGCFEGYDPANVSLTARDIDVSTGKVSTGMVWSFSTKGSSGERGYNDMDGVYKVLYPGCCAATDTFKYFSLYTGKFIGASYSKPLVLEMPNTRQIRYIFMQDNNASEYMGRSGQLALYYSDKERLRQQLSITASNVPEPFYCQTILEFVGKQGDRNELWGKSTFEGVSIVIKIDCPEGKSTTEIPVLKDSLSVEKAETKGTLGTKIADVTHNK
jgi:hypothetical protein